MTDPTVIDLFAGPGGWDVGARTIGLDPIGIEIDERHFETACRRVADAYHDFFARPAAPVQEAML